MESKAKGTPAGLVMIESHLTHIYVIDDQGRLVGDRSGGVPPRFVMARAADGCLWRFRSGLDESLVIAVARLAGRERGWPKFEGEGPPPPERLVMIARMLGSAENPASFERAEWAPEGELIAEIWTFD